jgi:hypothetical protein
MGALHFGQRAICPILSLLVFKGLAQWGQEKRIMKRISLLEQLESRGQQRVYATSMSSASRQALPGREEWAKT